MRERRSAGGDGIVADHEIERASTTPGLPVAPTLGPALEAAGIRRQSALFDRRALAICFLAIGVGAIASVLAKALQALIGLVTNLAYYGRVSTELVSPAGHALGPLAIAVPVVGGVIVGLMARFGSEKIRGHGIPEAMEQVLVGGSRIPPRLTFLKPASAAIAIGTGGPFGAEGPIIATGGAFGSLVGQLLETTAAERKHLLAAGAAAGMTATFGTPVSAVLLAVELLLFELRPASLVPVAFACATAMGIRLAFDGAAPFFPVPPLAPAAGGALALYAAIGAATGLAAVAITRGVYWIEDAFARLPIHWMWWPALGGVVVGVVGWVAPRTLGVGYANITDVISGRLVGSAVLILCGLKLVSWLFALGSGTSGGTLAPLFTIGGGFGALLGAGAALLLPDVGVDPRVAAIVGMAALFAGASRALLASIVFAFESTQAEAALLPLLAGCSTAFLVSCLLMRTTIMTEKIVRRGVGVPDEYVPDFLDHVPVRSAMSHEVVSLAAERGIDDARAWLDSGARGSGHQGFPVLDADGRLAGVVTRRDLLRPAEPGACVADLLARAPVVIHPDDSLRAAADAMTLASVGRLPVVSREEPGRLLGILSRSDLLAAHGRRLRDLRERRREVALARAERTHGSDPARRQSPNVKDP
jgi:H+/Cl- antiporter ClcA/CBS domain-containing protein